MTSNGIRELHSRLLQADALRLGALGLQSTPTRVVLSALGIAIGIAAMVAVMGISTSSQARLTGQLDALGTNLLTVRPGSSIGSNTTTLPPDAVAKVGLVPGVSGVASVAELSEPKVYRSRLVDPAQSGGIHVQVADFGVLEVLDGTVRSGRWFDAAIATYPTTVLGSVAAERLGIVETPSEIWLGETQVTVIGVLDRLPLAPELDTSAFIGGRFATHRFDWDGRPTALFERSDEALVQEVRELLSRTVDPENPRNVEVSRPSDALAAKNAADTAFTGLLLGLGSVALLVGGIGVANTMVISVMERRGEIGLRRALGATRAHIRMQFLLEALLLSALGGAAGTLLGLAVTAGFAGVNGWPLSVPPVVLLAGIGATVAIGAIAGILPAMRAARTPPSMALKAS
ncbi:MAG: ABC transporter permease [Rhodococcus sp. (in: high G+C Gram-positive bacteria)]|uniref:ABC transporter permease n=1 Tax=Rhodococcus sp. TaxID=1831 RepID=UPI003BB4E08F